MKSFLSTLMPQLASAILRATAVPVLVGELSNPDTVSALKRANQVVGQ